MGFLSDALLRISDCGSRIADCGLRILRIPNPQSNPQSAFRIPKPAIRLSAQGLHYCCARAFPAGATSGAFTGCGTVSVRLYFARVLLSVVAFAIAALRSTIALGVCALTSV